jgi:hypothetical protein
VKREPPRPTFDTPSRTIVIEPVVPVEDPPRDAVGAGDWPDPPQRDDDARPAPA